MKKIVFCLVVFAFMVCWPVAGANAELSNTDIEFLKQCGVQRTDIDIIPMLDKETQAEMYAWIAARDCSKWEPFKASRNQLRATRPNTRPPAAPEGFSLDYFTDAEYKYYMELLGIPPSFK